MLDATGEDFAMPIRIVGQQSGRETREREVPSNFNTIQVGVVPPRDAIDVFSWLRHVGGGHCVVAVSANERGCENGDNPWWMRSGSNVCRVLPCYRAEEIAAVEGRPLEAWR